MIVTTAMTAVTPTTMPISVRAVRNRLARKLPVATLKASQTAAIRKTGNDLIRAGRTARANVKRCGRGSGPPLRSIMLLLSDSFVFFDHAVANRNDAVGAFGDVVLVRNDDDGVAFGMQAFE